jgi:hypothetical protein
MFVVRPFHWKSALRPHFARSYPTKFVQITKEAVLGKMRSNREQRPYLVAHIFIIAFVDFATFLCDLPMSV